MIVGLGRTGYSCARYFRRKEIAFSIMDDASKPPFLEAVRKEMPDIQFDRINSPDLLQADEIVLSPGVPLSHEAIRVAKEAGIHITGDFRP